MSRLLFVLLVFAVAAGWLLRSIRNVLMRPETGQGTDKVRMVRCAHCNLYLSEQEAISGDGRYYCSESHRQLGPADAPS